MPSPFYYRSVIDRLARLAGPDRPSYIRLRAACALATELSPANPRRDQIQELLHAADPFAVARHKLRDLYDHADPQALVSSTDAPMPQEEQPAEEDDDPL